MAIIPGVSGAVVLEISSTWVLLENSQYEVELENLIEEVTTPNGYGWTEGLPKLQMVRRVDIRWFDRYTEGESIYPVLGYLRPGTEFTAYFRRGDQEQWYKVVRCVIRRLTMRNAVRNARTWELVGEHGRFDNANDQATTLEAFLESERESSGGGGSGGGGGGS